MKLCFLHTFYMYCLMFDKMIFLIDLFQKIHIDPIINTKAIQKVFHQLLLWEINNK